MEAATLKTKVREWCAAEDRSQAYLARQAEIGESHFSLVLKGERTLKPEVLLRLEAAMGLTEGALR